MAKSSKSLPSEFASLNQIKQRYGLESAHIVGCADGRFIAARLVEQRTVLVFDALTGELTANFFAGQGAWFGSLAFRPDGSALAAIVHSRSSGPKLIQWDTTTWKAQDPVPIGGLLAGSEPGDHISFSLDHRFLLIVEFRKASEEKSDVEIFTVDLLEDQLTAKSFAAGTIEHKLTSWEESGHRVSETIWWIASPNGKWIATSVARASYLFSRELKASRLRGRVIGFLSDGNHVVVYEVSDRLVWKEKRPAWESRPPFWNYFRFVQTSRVVILDCRNQQTIAQSRWLHGYQPLMIPNRSRLLVQRDQESVLVWDLPAVK